MKKSPNAEELERCIICGALTRVPISMVVDSRENYEVGCGQICAKCAEKLQNNAWQGNTLSYEQIISAIEKHRKKQ